jgi:dolichol-phosphate mannosyltransferase
MPAADPSPHPHHHPRLSIVVPLHDEVENLAELHDRLTAVLGATGETYEILLVDDGSRDATPLLADRLADADPHLRVIHLTRNFGHQPAISAGLERARGQAVILMDGDLQDPPEVLPEFLAAWRDGNDVVYAIRHHRKEGPLKRLGYFTFYRLLSAISDLDIPLDSGDFCLMDRRVVDTLNALPERMRFVRGLRTFVGYRQIGLPYERHARAGGTPKYSFRALVRLAIDGLVSFSGYPLRIANLLGVFGVLTALGLAAVVLIDAFASRTAPPGWASTMIVVLFMGSVQLISLGIIGEYVRLIFLETKGRPFYLVRNIHTHQGDEPAERSTESQANIST